MKCVIVSACYAIIAALISKIYLIFSSSSVRQGDIFGGSGSRSNRPQTKSAPVKSAPSQNY